MTNKVSFAPLEGITTHIYRNAHREMFGGCDEYYAPFVSPSDNEKIGRKGFRDILPENNPNIPLRVQVLTNNSVSFLKFADKIKEYGYSEINLNLGCPSGTVTGKGRGAGFLRDTERLDRFFSDVFKNANIKITVKTRIGFLSEGEMENLMKIYNKYPVAELIIHPRTREEFYKGTPHMDAFKKAYETSKSPVAYNGNIFKREDFERITKEYPNLSSVMIGRGAIQNPAIFREIKGGKRLSTQELLLFSKKLEKCYEEKLDCNVFTVHKLKEVWLYMMENFPEETKILKAIKKATHTKDIISATDMLPEISN